MFSRTIREQPASYDGRGAIRALRWMFFLFLPVLFTPVQAQDRHLRTSYSTPQFSSLQQWLERVAELREHILVSTGLQPLPEKTPLNPILGSPAEYEGYTVQSVALETLPGFYLTANLYRPEGSGPFPAVLSPHGHWENGRLEDSPKASVPGRAINFARQGYLVLTYSMIGFNETKELLPHRFHDSGHELWGFSAMGLQLWNSLRALDYLASLPEVDPERIGMTGASGGGTQTFLLTAVDERIKAAAPVNMISAHFQGGCVCENAPLLRLHTTNVEIGALAAPRPLLLVSTSGDWTMETPYVEFPAIQAIYRLFGAEDRVANAHFYYEHNYNRDTREAVYQWFSRWLLKKETPSKERAFEAPDPSILRATLPEAPLKLEELFEQFVQRSRDQISRARPRDRKQIQAYRQTFGKALTHVLESPETSDIDLELFAPEERSQATPAVLIVHPGHGGDSEAREVAKEHVKRGWLTFLFKPSTEESLEPPSEIQFWTTYNATPASRAINQIRAAAEQILNRPDIASLNLIGLAQTGPWTLMARSLIPQIRETSVDFRHFKGNDDWFLENLFIPLIRRAGDFQTAAVMIAPAPLTINNMPEGRLKGWFQDVYEAAAARDLLLFGE